MLANLGHPDIYGLPKLRPEQKELAKMGTLLALRARDSAEACVGRNIPIIAETPKLGQGHPSVFKIPEWIQLIADASFGAGTPESFCGEEAQRIRRARLRVEGLVR